MRLETERLTLSELTAAEACFVIDVVNEPGWLAYIGDRNIHDEAAALAYITAQAANYATGLGMWRVALKASDEPIGFCGLLQREELDHPDIGFAFLARHQRKGYAEEASRAVIAYARDTLKAPSLYAFTHPENDASGALLLKLAFAYQGLKTWPEKPPTKLYALDL